MATKKKAKTKKPASKKAGRGTTARAKTIKATKPKRSPKPKRTPKPKRATGIDRRKLPKSERPAPTSGQHGESHGLTLEKLNADEHAVIATLQLAGSATGNLNDPKMSVTALALALDAKTMVEDPSAIKLRVRNAMRRLVREGFVVRNDRALYSVAPMSVQRTKAAPITDEDAKGPPLKCGEESHDGDEDAEEPLTEEPSGMSSGLADEPQDEAGYKKLTRWRDTAKTLIPNIGTEELKTALVVLAAREDLGNVHISRITNISRGFIIPRLRRLKEAGRVLDVSSGVGLTEAIRIACGATP